jgi:NAD(P)H-hydrate epimerase
MTKVYTPAASRQLDAACIAAGLSEIDLIQHASSSAAECIESILSHGLDAPSLPCHIVIVCGSGNNGADGLTIAAILSRRHRLTVICPETTTTGSPGFIHARTCLPSAVCQIAYNAASSVLPSEADVVIDALLGTGSRLPLSDQYRHLVELMNQVRGLRIAIDIPTGLDALTGQADAVAFQSHHTVTMEGLKPGLLRADGPNLCGRTHIAQIGAPAHLSERLADGAVLDEADLRSMLPVRERVTSKFDYGHVAVVGGSLGMRGAPSMTAHAAIAIGAGLVELITPSVHPLTPREVMTTCVGYHDDGTIAAQSQAVIADRLRRATVIAIGPGLGANPRTLAMLAELIDDYSNERTVVLDADGLRCLPLLLRPASRIVLTPHLGELGRLLGRERSDIAIDYVEHAQSVASDHSAIVHIKHVPAATCSVQHVTYLQRGNPAMASAGSGDVLTGIIAGLAAQHMSVYDATRCGAWLHADAGDHIVAQTRKTSIMATELIEAAACRRGDLMATPP